MAVGLSLCVSVLVFLLLFFLKRNLTESLDSIVTVTDSLRRSVLTDASHQLTVSSAKSCPPSLLVIVIISR